MTARVVLMEMTVTEAAHLTGLCEQFSDMVDDARSESGAPGDDAIARLVPDAYPDDHEASQEFRELTGSGLLERRHTDVESVLATLLRDGKALSVDSLADDADTEVFPLTLSIDQAGEWMRTLAAIRLVLASRLGIETDDSTRYSGPQFAIYDWLSYRLDALVTTLDEQPNF